MSKPTDMTNHPDRPLVKILAAGFCNKNAKLVSQLYGRWLDEREYEDINDYLTAFKKANAEYKGIVVEAVTKRPFGFWFTATAGGCSISYHLKATMRSVKWLAYPKGRK